MHDRRAIRHPSFDEYWESHYRLVYWWSRRVCRILNQRRYHGGIIWSSEEFEGELTILFNYSLHYFDENGGANFSTFFGRFAIAHCLKYVVANETEAHRVSDWNRRCTSKEMRVQQLNKESYESDYFLYRVPEKYSDDWASEIVELFADPASLWSFLTRDMPEKAKDIMQWYYRDGKTGVEIASLLGCSRQPGHAQDAWIDA